MYCKSNKQRVEFYETIDIKQSSYIFKKSKELNCVQYTHKLANQKNAVLVPLQSLIPVDLAKIILNYSEFKFRIQQLVEMQTLIPSTRATIQPMLQSLLN